MYGSEKVKGHSVSFGYSERICELCGSEFF